jgi:acyl carrier protein phosphodiesterase
MSGILSNLSSNRENNFLKINDDANKPSIVIKAIKMENEINVFKNELPVKPANENKLSKN